MAQEENANQYNYKEITYKSFNLEDEDFVFLFKRLKSSFKICFLNTFVRYISGNKVYEFYTNDGSSSPKQNEQQQKIKVYEKIPIELIKEDNANFHVVTFQKHKIPYYLFPSDNSFDDMHYVNKYIIRIHNNIYLNFETITYGDGDHVNKIFINYNRESKLDESLITKLIDEVKNTIKTKHHIEVPIF
jgi:hypothetical protein